MQFIARSLLMAGIVALQAMPGSARPVATTQQPRIADHAEMSAMYEADQAIRRKLAEEGFRQDLDDKMVEDDAKHYARTKELVRSGALKTGNDFQNAAFIFQHGSEPSDYLLAHTLAVAAIARGRTEATWIAAATLDRYLQTIGQKQIYGTQFGVTPDNSGSQEPYDRSLIPDELRKLLRVPVQAEQERQRRGMKSEPLPSAPAAKPRN